MKFNLLLISLLIFSCTTSSTNKGELEPYTSKGFALIYNDLDYDKKLISHRLNNLNLEIGHNRVKKNSIIKITNPENKKSIELKVNKKINYPNFYKIILTEKVAKKLGLDTNLPYVDIQEKFKNKSFIAKKAVTHSEEQKVFNRAPITKVQIDNLSSLNNKRKKIQKFTIIVGDFYSGESAKNLKDTLEHMYVKKGSLKVKKLAKNKFRLFAGPYSSINTLKERYFELNKYGFEDLDIIQND